MLAVEFEEAISGKHSKFKTTIQHKTYTTGGRRVGNAPADFNRLTDETKGRQTRGTGPQYGKVFTVEKLEGIVSNR